MNTLATTAAIVRRELLSLFVSPIAYIILFVFLLVNGGTFQFYLTALDGRMETVLISQFGGITFWFLFLLVPPLITMRAFAEERRSGTFELLVSTGAPDPAIVLGKFIASWIFFMVLWCALLPLLVLVERVGGLDRGMVLSLYLGLASLGALFIALGLLASSWTGNQLLGAAVAMAANLGIFFLSYLRQLFRPGDIELRYFEFLSPLYHFANDFSQGVVDLRVLLLYGSVTVWALFLTVKVLERRRWA